MTFKSQEIIEQNLQSALNQLHVWCKSNGMLLNLAKTKVMLSQRLNTDSLCFSFKDETLQMIIRVIKFWVF